VGVLFVIRIISINIIVVGEPSVLHIREMDTCKSSIGSKSATQWGVSGKGRKS